MKNSVHHPTPAEKESYKNKLDLGQKVVIILIIIMFFLVTLFNALVSESERNMGAFFAYLAASICSLVVLVKFWRKYV